MIKRLRTVLLAFAIGIPVSVFGAFVVESYWNWFVVPPLHAESIGLLGALGLLWLCDLILARPSESAVSEKRWNLLFGVIDRCLPADRVQTVQEWVKEETSFDSWEVFGTSAKRLGTFAVSFILGYVLHVFV